MKRFILMSMLTLVAMTSQATDVAFGCLNLSKVAYNGLEIRLTGDKNLSQDLRSLENYTYLQSKELDERSLDQLKVMYPLYASVSIGAFLTFDRGNKSNSSAVIGIRAKSYSDLVLKTCVDIYDGAHVTDDKDKADLFHLALTRVSVPDYIGEE